MSERGGRGCAHACEPRVMGWGALHTREESGPVGAGEGCRCLVPASLEGSLHWGLKGSGLCYMRKKSMYVVLSML